MSRSPRRLPFIVAVVPHDPQNADDFFRSVQVAFRANEQNASAVGYTLLALALAAGLAALARRPIRRWRAEREAHEEFLRFSAAHALVPEDVALLTALGEHAGTAPLIVATHLDVFERATAAELRGLLPTFAVREGDVHARTRALRERLGFALRASHEPLLTTRELSPGYAVEIAGARTAVTEVTEAFFSVVVGDRPEVLGVKMPLTVLHEHEASYSVACTVLAVEPVRKGWALVFAHDELPARVQKRAFVRVTATGPIHLVPVGRPASADAREQVVRMEGTLIDLNLHGVALGLREKIAVRARLYASFSFGGELFAGLDAIALDCQGPPAGPYRLRLEFSALSVDDDRRLAAAIARASARRSSAPRP